MELLCCRYHFNVVDSRLQQHVDKGREDGLYISSVASSLSMWALVMDAGTGYSAQVFELSPIFLHKVGVLEIPFYTFASFSYAVALQVNSYSYHQEWIMDQWDKNYYITSVAGACNGSALVVMSQGRVIFHLLCLKKLFVSL